MNSLELFESIAATLSETATQHHQRDIFRLEDTLKAFETIKSKSVDVGFIQMLEINKAGGVREYNDYARHEARQLTPREYDLIAKVVKL